MNELNVPPDLTKTPVLLSQIDEMIGGMDQQARASGTRNAMSGHPFPAFFFNRVAETLRAAATKIKQLEMATAPVPTPASARKTPEPAEKRG